MDKNEKVSLPGAGGTEETPTILEVINNRGPINETVNSNSNNNNNNKNNKGDNKDVDTVDAKSPPPTQLLIATNINNNQQTSSSSSLEDRNQEEIGEKNRQSEEKEISQLTPSELSGDVSHLITATNEIQDANKNNNRNKGNDLNQSDAIIDDNSNIRNIESHLIETIENLSVSEDNNSSGINIKEVPPSKEELSKPSIIETETGPRTVIEIEPSAPKTLKAFPLELHLKAQEFTIIDCSGTIGEDNIEEISNNNNNTNNNQDKSSTATVLTNKQEIENITLIRSESDNNNNEGSRSEICYKVQIKDILPENSELITENVLEVQKKEQSENPNKSNSEPTTYKVCVVESSLLNNINESEDKIAETSPQKEDHSVNNVGTKEEESVLNNCSGLAFGINGLPTSLLSKTEAEAKKIFLDSIPQLSETENSDLLSTQAKEESSATNHYQPLWEYLKQYENDHRPPIPLQTYRWEDLRRAKQQGGYPWTHLYKRPLGPDEEPEIVLLLQKSQENQSHLSSESPKSFKKVRIYDKVLVKETEKYINDLSDPEDNTTTEDDSRSVQSDSATTVTTPKSSKAKKDKLRGILKHRPLLDKLDLATPKLKVRKGFGKKKPEESSSTPAVSNKGNKCCHPIMDKLRNMADKQFKKKQIKKIPLKGKEKIVLSEEQTILKLKQSPKAERSGIPHFIEKQDSDEVIEIVELEESPSKARRRREEQIAAKRAAAERSTILVPDEIIELPTSVEKEEQKEESKPPTPLSTPEPEILETIKTETIASTSPKPPVKAPRKRKDHVYEDIDDENSEATIDERKRIDKIIEETIVDVLKKSLASQDASVMKDLEVRTKLEEMGSSEEDTERPPLPSGSANQSHLAPLSSIDSTSSDEDRKSHLPTLAEESDAEKPEDISDTVEIVSKPIEEQLKLLEENEKETEVRSVLKRESSPNSGNDNKKVTFSYVEDEAEPLREDVELPEQFRAKESRWSKMSDHEYEPIGEPATPEKSEKVSEFKNENVKEKSPTPVPAPIPTVNISEPMEVEKDIADAAEKNVEEEKVAQLSDENIAAAQEMQKDIEDRYFSSSTATTPRSESRTDYEIHTSQVDSSALEELPLKRENRGSKKGFIASAQDTSRKMSANIRNQAGKLRTKLRGVKKPSSSSGGGSPKKKDNRKRFRAPDFSKIKMPDIKRPDMSKFKAPDFKKIEFKRPEFTKFQKPDMSKFKIPEKFSSLKLKRSKSLRESDVSPETLSETTLESTKTPKKKFEFNFGTYPRVLRRKKERLATQVVARADDLPSTETPTSFESSVVHKRGTRDKGPVGSRWQDKFSDVSYGDSESGKYQRYGSEPESIERESSLERRMKYDTGSDEIDEDELRVVETVEQKQFAEYDEENRAIHEISKTRESEFKKRRPMIHQDSDLVSEESKDVGWTEKDIMRSKNMRADLENDNYPSEEGLTGSMTNTNQETQSTGSSGHRQKGVLEEIDDDEFFLRKRGISQDNIEIRQYISAAIREGLDTPVNALAQLGDSQTCYPEFQSDEQMGYGYDVPPPKPRRVKHSRHPQDSESVEVSQDFDVENKEGYGDNISLPQTGSDYFKNVLPARPLRKTKKQYSEESQEVPQNELPYFENEDVSFYKKDELNDLEHPQIKLTYENDFDQVTKGEPPKAPKRRKKQLRESVEKEYLNGFGGRSISNTFLQNEDHANEIIVYRTEHQYPIPLAQAETLTTPTPTPRRSRSRSRGTADDDRTSHGADSLILDSHPLNEEMKETDGYATVRKEPPPRPPPPARRKRSPRPSEEHFATMPHLRDTERPERPTRNYSTIGPSRPPRRKSNASIEAMRSGFLPDASPYEELDLEDAESRLESSRDLQSGDVINKMKHRPLPPPPRPPREQKRPRGFIDEDKFDTDGGGEKMSIEIQRNGNYEINKTIEKCIEVEVATQTDPLPDDFEYEEFEITEDMKIIEPRVPRTLEDILKEDQELELEKAQDDLVRSVQKFREAGQRSVSERSRGSTKTHSRPTTPSAILVERRVPTPVPHRTNESMLEASLTVKPVNDFDVDYEVENEYNSSLKSEESADVKPLNTDAVIHRKVDENDGRRSDRSRDRERSSLENEESVIDYRKKIEEEIERRLKLQLEAEERERAAMEEETKKLEIEAEAEERAKAEAEEYAMLEAEMEALRKEEAEIEALRKEEAEMEALRKEEAEIEALRKEEAEIEALRKEEAEMEALRKEETEKEVLRKQEAEMEILRKEEAEKEVLRKKEAEMEALRKKEAEIEALKKKEAEMEALRQEGIEKEFQISTEQSTDHKSEISVTKEIISVALPLESSHEPVADLDTEDVHSKIEKEVKHEDKDEYLSDTAQPSRPLPPPRRRSYSQTAETTETSLEPSRTLSVIEEQSQSVTPGRLTISDLEVERLNVHALQAGKIVVSELQGVSVNADELACRSGNLVVRNLELPPGLIESIIERIRNIDREQSQSQAPVETQTAPTQESTAAPLSPSHTAPAQDHPPVRPPPPQQSVFPSEYFQYSIPPPSFYQLRSPSDEDRSHSPHQIHRRRRHYRRHDSSSDEENYRERRRSRQNTRSPEPSVSQLGTQLVRACGNSVLRTLNQIINHLQSAQKEGNERNISTAIALLILMTLGVIFLGLSGKNIHHHHWDFFNPPGNNGRSSQQ